MGATRASALAVYIQMTFLLVSLGFFLVAGDGRFAPGPEKESLNFLLRAWILPPVSDWPVFAAIGLAAGGIGYCLSAAYRLADAATIAPFEYIGLPLAIFWGWAIFGEWPDPVVWLGCALIVGTTGLEAACFVNPTDPEALPTHEAYCIPVMYLNDAQARTIPEDYGVSIQMVLLKPRSTGDVKLASANPDDMPLVNPNFLSDERDMDEMVKGLRYFRETMNQSPLADRIAEGMAPTDYSDAALRDHCRRVVKTNFHPAGTAKMGADGDPMAVLDARMRVRGVEGLRVCDMSAVPDIPAGNTNAPAMVLGDRCAEMVLGRL